MAKKSINIGGQANDGTGDSIRDAFEKVNQNFDEIYLVGVGSTVEIFDNLNAKFEASYTNLLSVIRDSTATGVTQAIINYVSTVTANSTQSLAQRIITLETDFQTLATSTQASVAYVDLAVSNSTSSLAQRILTVETNYVTTGSLSTYAKTTDVNTAISASTASIATRLNTVETNYVTTSSLSTYAKTTDVNTAISNSTASVASRLTTLESSYTNLLNTVTTIATYTNLIVSSANTVSSLVSTVETLQANYTALASTSAATVSYVDLATAASTASIAYRLSSIETNYVTTGSLSTYAKTADVNTAISNSTSSLATKVSTLESSYTNIISTFDGYATTASLASYAKTADVTTAISASTASVASRVSTLESSYTNIISTFDGYATTASLASYAKSSDVNTAISNSTASLATKVSTLESSYTNIVSTFDGYATTSSLTSYAKSSDVNTAISNSTASLATSLSSLQTSVGTLTTTVTTFASSINGIQGKYGVTINTGTGAITGYELIGGGSSSSFVVNADTFKVTGSGFTNTGYAVFSVDTVNQKINLNGDVVVTGTVKVGSSPTIVGTTMTGYGAVIGNTGTFAFGNTQTNMVFNGSNVYLNGFLNATSASSDGTGVSSSTTTLLTFTVSKTNNIIIQLSGYNYLFLVTPNIAPEYSNNVLTFYVYDSSNVSMGSRPVNITTKVYYSSSQDLYGSSIPLSVSMLFNLSPGTYTLKVTSFPTFRNSAGTSVSSWALLNNSLVYSTFAYESKV